ncbi:MAG: hypothetical protein IKM25_03810 [Clostridia bacterium]|nr:hypothetical protein [Clostridia bacterium]
MSDYNKITSGSELDAILEEVKNKKFSSAGETSVPAKTWSLDDIDRLIAETNGEEYIPPKKEEKTTPAQDFAKILGREFDTGLFTIRPMGEENKKPEMQDISSSSGDAEVDGQETFYDKENDFDESIFEIETVIVPEDKTDNEEDKVSKYLNPEPTVAEEPESEPPVIEDFYEGETPASEFFKKIAEALPEEDKQEEKFEETVKEDLPEHISEKDYRTRFFTKLQLERTADVDIEEDGPVDKPGIVVKKNGDPDEGGFQPVPKVLTAEDAEKEIAADIEKTRIVGGNKAIPVSKKPETPSDDVEGQIMLTGFEDISSETVPDQADEEDIEETLWEKRKQKAKDFRLIDAIDLDEEFQGDFEMSEEEKAREERARRREERRHALEREKQEFINRPVANEYTSPEEKTAFYTRFGEISKNATKGIIIAGAIELLVVIINLIPLIAEKLSVETEIFTRNSVAVNVMNAILLIAAAAINSKRFADGIKSLTALKITSDTAVSLSIIVALVQNTIAAVVGPDGIGATVFSAAAVFGVLVTKITEKLDAQRILGNFEVCAFKYKHNMYAVHPFDNESEIFELGRGLMMGNADLLYSSKVSFPENFLKNSKAVAAENRLMKFLVPGAAGAALVAAIASGIVNRDVMAALSAFAGTFCICSPVFSAFIPAFISRSTNATLNAGGTVITGSDIAEQTASSNAVVLDSADIFDRERCTMHGMKDFKNIRIDDVLLYAAALVIKSGGPLRESFEQVVDGRQDILPAVKELTYEDKLGIAARIHNQKVLLGNRNLLVNHNVEVPEKSLEERYSHSGRKVMYLAVAGKVAALFVVSYAVDKNLGGYFRVLEDNGIQVLVRTNDVNVTQELIADSFGLPRETFKILSGTAGRLFKRRRDAVCDKLPAGIIHDGTAYSMLRAVAAACDMSAKMRFSTVVQIILSVLGFILSMVLYCVAKGAFVNGLTAVLFLALGMGVSAGLMLLRKIK